MRKPQFKVLLNEKKRQAHKQELTDEVVQPQHRKYQKAGAQAADDVVEVGCKNNRKRVTGT